MTPTFIVQIGNSDDKLSQADWSRFLVEIERVVNGLAEERHFTGYSIPTAPWQNACWVFTPRDGATGADVETRLALIARKYRQNSIAFTQGSTTLVAAAT